MRDDVVETTFDAMSPELRALIAYDPNGALDVEVPQDAIDEVRRTMPVVRWEMGVGFFGMDDVVAAGRNPDIGSVVMGMGTDDPLIPLHLDGDVHRHYRKLLDPLFTPRKMAALEPDIRKLADELIDGFIGDGQRRVARCVLRPAAVDHLPAHLRAAGRGRAVPHLDEGSHPQERRDHPRRGRGDRSGRRTSSSARTCASPAR